MKSTVTEICTEQTRYFQTGVTRDIQFRKNSLRLLLQNIQQHEKEICKALYQDLRKPEFESLSTEIYMVLKELRYTLKNLNRWTKSQRVGPSWLNFPSTDSLHYQPYGRVLIIAPLIIPSNWLCVH
jgi:aldehyde dehydrogenase (NAD+)